MCYSKTTAVPPTISYVDKQGLQAHATHATLTYPRALHAPQHAPLLIDLVLWHSRKPGKDSGSWLGKLKWGKNHRQGEVEFNGLSG
jgi:hypothetical protein